MALTETTKKYLRIFETPLTKLINQSIYKSMNQSIQSHVVIYQKD